ncbi:Pth11-like integral membrane protein [Histoplasma capsulatum G186AR]|uniref:Pth11-like integral membrane protein n=1 Tax=Ajellomyces capsulatus TaxID=5037 RepID=A0A8H8CSB5_AJECA|nr:Pth11-like integral membrane protein [Histoplasma capsulatum]QSS73259.1 Pth11-like integral membrane protein [Histoplasma capsulatum G186AR]
MSSVLGGAPPGTDLTENRNREFNASVATVYGLAVISVALRFFTRVKVQNFTVKADDWLILVSLASVTCSFALAISGGQYGLGKHVWIVPLSDVMVLIKLHYIYMFMYILNVPLIKFSILLFYRRIFGMNWSMWVCFFLSGGYYIACTITLIIACQPISYYWTQVQDAKSGSCRFQPHIFYLGNAAANVATDVLILLVPIPLVWKLQMPTSKKILVSSLFLLGTFVCVVSIIRIKFMGELARAKDVTFILVNIFLWSFVEPCIGIVCACLPTLRPLLQKVSRVLFGTEFGKSFSSGPGISPGLVRTQQSTTVDGTKKQKNGFQRMKGAVGEKPESGNGRMRLRPTEDETALTTVSAQFEMDDFRRNGTSDVDSESQNQSSGIRVKTDFGWQEDVQ